jgi:DNA-binding response OmpR family regulator
MPPAAPGWRGRLEETGESGLQGLRVLVVEDVFSMALVMENTLTALGCTVVGPVARLEDARELALSEPLDGALLDVNLNGEAVYPVVDELQARGVPLIFVTGYSAGALPEAYRKLPRVVKPFDMRALVQLMSATFGAKRR